MKWHDWLLLPLIVPIVTVCSVMMGIGLLGEWILCGQAIGRWADRMNTWRDAQPPKHKRSR